MDEKKLEEISALADGESSSLNSAAGADGWERDPEVRAVWSRYHLISDLLRRDLPPGGPVDLQARVARALEQEPTILAPGRFRQRAGALVRQVSGMAVAASVAVAVVLGVQQIQTGVSGPDPVVPQMAQIQPQSPPSQTTAADIVAVSGTRWALAQPEVERRLNGYLIDHSERATGVGVQAMMPYVQVVGYGD
ncbi:MAG: sigma-E factor negative regulatory protein [Gammaproteobacteria bacterium]|nr:sigma-E factor negative regulatory protein [Gammaproteobacteria bacterium]